MKSKVIISFAVVVAIMISVLLYNKSKMEAQSRSGVMKSIPVSVATAVRTRLNDAHVLTGTITPNNDVAILSETEGKVVGVYAKVGDFKSAGSVIVQIDDEVKKAALEMAEANYEKTKKDLDRFESLHGQHAVTDQQYENARLTFKTAESQYIIARRQFNDTKIKTPVSGIVAARPVDVGALVQNKMFVANVVDMSKLKVKLNVAEQDVFRLAVGGKVQITTDVYPGAAFDGKIETISSKADEAHTYPVEVSLPNSKNHPLKAGMFARVALNVLSADGLIIPRGALVGSIKKPQVFVVAGGIATLRDVIIRDEIGSSLEILSGVKEGESVVVNGQNNLKDGSLVSPVSGSGSSHN